MLDGIKNLFKKEKEPVMINVKDKVIEMAIENAKRLIRDEELKLREHGVVRSVAITEMKDLAEEPDECSTECELCIGSGYLYKDLRLIYPCKNCNCTGKTYWVDRMLTASKAREYQDRYYTTVRNNLHALTHEIKQEAMKIGAVASVKITIVDGVKGPDLNYLNKIGGLDIDDES